MTTDVNSCCCCPIYIDHVGDSWRGWRTRSKTTGRTLEGGRRKPDLIKVIGPEPIITMSFEAPPVVTRARNCDGQRGKRGGGDWVGVWP